MASPFGQDRNPFGANRSRGPQEDEGWLITYADTITNLMALFIMMLAVSTVDLAAFEQVSAQFQKDFTGKETARPISEIRQQIEKIVESKGLEDEVEVSQDKKGVVVEFSSNILFNSGKADLLPAIKPTFTEIAEELKNETYRSYTIEVEGHTDDNPIRTGEFPSNWELSSRRATNVIRFMLDADVAQSRLKAAGYADIHPKVPNRDAMGKAIPENQARNRRIVIRLYPESRPVTVPVVDRKEAP
ncbi:Motility protein B [compost metagenome]